jgi:hypothetical protein
LAQIYSLFSSEIILTYAGNPNGSVAGTTYQLLWDSNNKLTWICTQTGTTSSAVWQPVMGPLTNGELYVGSSGNAPVATTLTAGTNINITNAPGSITIAAGGIPGISWTTVTGVSASMSADSGYVTNNAGLVTLTLPTVAGLGTVLYIAGLGAGGWSIAQNSGQNINVGSVSTTVGVSGSLSSTNQYDTITLVCIVANTTWSALGAPQSLGLTIV